MGVGRAGVESFGYPLLATTSKDSFGDGNYQVRGADMASYVDANLMQGEQVIHRGKVSMLSMLRIYLEVGFCSCWAW